MTSSSSLQQFLITFVGESKGKERGGKEGNALKCGSNAIKFINIHSQKTKTMRKRIEFPCASSKAGDTKIIAKVEYKCESPSPRILKEGQDMDTRYFTRKEKPLTFASLNTY